MATPLPVFRKGATPTLLDTATANQIRDAIEAFRTLTLSPAGCGKLIVGDKRVVLDLSPILALINKIQTAQVAFNQTSATGSGSGGLQFPFQIIFVNETTINVRYGTVMDIPPTDVGVDADVTAITTSGTATVYIDNTLDAAGNVTDSAMALSATGKPADTSDHAYKLVGEVIVVASAITTINQSLMFSQGFKACDRDSGDPVTTPGTYEFFVT